MTLVTRMFQVKIGIRNIVIPGARMQTTVVIMLTAPRIVPSPAIARPMIHRSAPAPGRMQRVAERGVGRPAEVGRAARGEETRHGDQRAEQIQPVAERVQARERHVGRADLKRQNAIGETEHDRGGIQQQHDRAVHGEQLVVLLIGQELQTRRARAPSASAAPSTRRP